MTNIIKHIFPVFILTLSACGSANGQETNTNSHTASGQTAEAVFAGGCFWCVEADFEKLPGVIEAISGYTGGHTKNPTYKQVGRGGTGHYEVAKIIYDPSVVSYEQLLEHFWIHVDPTDDGGQFCDRGDVYKTAIFATPVQLPIAKASKRVLMSSNRLQDTVVTPVLAAAPFYTAETYHQDYYKKNPIRYKYYRNGCRRDATLRRVWGQ